MSVNEDLVNEVKNMSIGEHGRGNTGKSQGDISPRSNPWRGRSMHSGAQPTRNDPTQNTPALSGRTENVVVEELFESDSWPEPSAPLERRPPPPTNNTKSNEDRPKKGRNKRWVHMEVNNTRNVTAGPTRPVGSNQPLGQCQGSNAGSGNVGSGRRGTLSNSSFSRGRGRPMNGTYQSRHHRGNEADSPKVVPTENDAANADPGQKTQVPPNTHGGVGVTRVYSSRGRRNGGRGSGNGYTNNTPRATVSANAQPVVSVPLGFPHHQVPASALTAVPQPIQTMNPVDLFYAQPNLSSTTVDAIALPGGAATAVALNVPTNVPQVLPTNSNSDLVQKKNVSLEDLIKTIKEFGVDKTIIPERLRALSPMRAFLAESQSIQAAGDATEVANADNGRQTSIVIVDQRLYFVPLGPTFGSFLQFPSKEDYVRHHVAYYFSAANLAKDNHLRNIMLSSGGHCPISTLLTFNRLNHANTTAEEVVEAAKLFPHIRIVYDGEEKPIALAPAGPAMVPDVNVQLATTMLHGQSTSEVSNNVLPNVPADIAAIPGTPFTQAASHMIPLQLMPGAGTATISAAAIPSLPTAVPPNGVQHFFNQNIIPYAGITPGVPPSYFNAATATLAAPAPAASGDQATNASTQLNPALSVQESGPVFYPFWRGHPLAFAGQNSFIHYPGSQHTTVLFPMLPPQVSRNQGLIPHQVAVPMPQQQARAFRAPHRPPSNRPVSGDNRVVEESNEPAP